MSQRSANVNASRSRSLGLGALLLPLLLFLLCCMCVVGSQWIMERAVVGSVTGTVTDKYIKRVGSSNTAADVFHVAIRNNDTGEVEVLQNKDAYTWGKVNSADVQQALVIGHTYRFTVAGVRLPLISAFRNIVQYEEVSPHRP